MVKTSFIDSVKQGIEIVKLNGKAAVNVSKDKNATLMGILIVIIGSILSAILTLAENFDLLLIILTPIISLVLFFVGVGIIHLLARLFGGKAKYMELFRAQSHAAILGWLGFLAIIPLVGGIINFSISLWGIVVNVVILENVHKLTRWKAIVVVLILVMVLLVTLLVAIGALAYFGVLSPEVLMPQTINP